MSSFTIVFITHRERDRESLVSSRHAYAIFPTLLEFSTVYTLRRGENVITPSVEHIVSTLSKQRAIVYNTKWHTEFRQKTSFQRYVPCRIIYDN